MKTIIKIFLVFFSIVNMSHADLIKPKPLLKPIDVLIIQLDSLKNNDVPFLDAGIKQTWEFAHPNNKKITGPYNKFKKMIYSENYKILISHKNSEVIVLKETKNISIYKVIILSKDKKKYYYIWQIEKVLIDGFFKNCWITASVSAPKFLGEVI
tara:strand:- start:661 stop:1122 length:462 start_codon:yes stop_codon:yes gene_type:complete